MALITCPICGKEVPDTSEKCDNCRFSIGEFVKNEKETAKRKQEREERRKTFARIVENSDNLSESLAEIKNIAYGQIPESLQNELDIVDFKPDIKSRSKGELIFLSDFSCFL